MISRKKVKKLINESEEKYLQCWDIISNLKSNQIDQQKGEDILEFQPLLARTLRNLSRLYQELNQEKNHFISRKETLSQDWFERRLRLIKDYQEQINSTIGIGKCLGDSFAWIFYSGQRELLVEHYKQQKQSYIPPGIGGKGEIAFIENLRKIQGHLVLYHGITSFLRIGDVSFIDLKKGELSAMGELKTKMIDSDELSIHLVSLGRIEKRNFFEDIEGNLDQKNQIDNKLSQQQKEKLNRQIKKMASSLEATQPDSNLRIDNIETAVHAINDLIKKLEKSRIAYQQIGDGHLLVGYRNDGKKLQSRIAPSRDVNWDKQLSGAVENILAILDKDSKENSLIISNILNPSDKYGLLLGTTPLFWWPLDLDTIKKIIFHEITLLSLYNSLHFERKLEKIGLTVDLAKDQNGLKVSKRIGEGVIAFEKFSYFMSLIIHNLISEESILEMIENVISKIEDGDFPPNTRIDLQFFLYT